MQMSDFTIWHYLNFLIIASALIVAIIYALKQKNMTQKSSFIATYCIIAFSVLMMTHIGINTYTRQVTLLSIENHRFLSTESIIFTGTIRNTGNYDVGEVELEIKIFDKGSKKQGSASYESTAFKDFYNDSDIRKLFGFKNTEALPSSYTISKTLTKELKAGHTESFAVSIDYPPHFRGYIDKERLIVH